MGRSDISGIKIPCGSELDREEVGTFNIDVA
jgi:hypothetical protein